MHLQKKSGHHAMPREIAGNQVCKGRARLPIVSKLFANIFDSSGDNVHGHTVHLLLI